MLKSRFIPVALDQAYQRRQQDTEGDFYRRIAGQGPRNHFNGTTQGFYIATAAGELLLYNNNRDPDKLRRLMQEKLAQFEAQGGPAKRPDPLQAEKVDPRYHRLPPEGGLVLRVRAKVLGGYPPPADRWQEIFQSALSRDNLWASADEHRALVRGELPETLLRRLARFHLVDNTRGEPPMWKDDEVRILEVRLADGQITGNVHLETDDSARGYRARLFGKLEVAEDRVVRLDLVARGEFWGRGPFTPNPPPGRFPLAVSFSLADFSDPADRIPPQGSRGWPEGYLR